MFYDNIYKICNDKGTTPTTVLKELGFSSGNVSKWKNGSVPNIEMCLAIARKLNVSLDYLITLDGRLLIVRCLIQTENGWTSSPIFRRKNRKCAKISSVPTW